MAKYKVISTTEEHILELSQTMRKDDIAEVWAGWHKTPLEALRISAEYTKQSWTGLADDRVVCMFGIAQPSILSYVGAPWLLGSEELPKHFRTFLRGNKIYIKAIKKEFELLENYVDTRNTTAIRWLKWLGFELSSPEPYGVERRTFRKFTMKGDAPCAALQQLG